MREAAKEYETRVVIAALKIPKRGIKMILNIKFEIAAANQTEATIFVFLTRAKILAMKSEIP